MVQELHVEDSHEGEVAWEDRVNFYYEMAVDGVPLPEKLHKLHLDRFSHFLGERDGAVVRTEKLWDDYMVRQGSLAEDPRSPRERLEEYFGSKK